MPASKKEVANKELAINMFSDLRPVQKLPVRTSTSLTSSASQTSSATSASNRQIVRKKHTFELDEERFESFALLVKATGYTLNDYIDRMIDEVVEDNYDLIQQLKKRRRR